VSHGTPPCAAPTKLFEGQEAIVLAWDPINNEAWEGFLVLKRKTGWWQLKYVIIFTRIPWGNGWFNHQLTSKSY